MLDGIKKISGQDLNKARDVVLRSIGENKKRSHSTDSTQKPRVEAGGFDIEKNGKQTAPKFKKIDGISFGKINNAEKHIYHNEAVKKNKQEEEKRILAQEKEKKLAVEKENAIYEKNKREEKKQAILNKKARAEKIKKKKLSKRAKAQKHKSAKAKVLENILKGKIARIFSAKIFLKFFIYVLSVLAMAFILFYILFFTALTIFNYDSNIARKVSQYLPVPAMAAKIGIVEYYDYKDAMDNFYYYNQENLEGVKKELIKEIAIDDFVEKYGIQITDEEQEQEFGKITSGKSEDEIKKIMGAYYELGAQRYIERVIKPRMASEKANQAILCNQEINYFALSRIAKIRQAAETGKDFYTVAEEMGDGFGFGKYYDFDEAVSVFGDLAKSISIGQTSDVIIINNRYYAIHCFARRENSIGLNSAASPESPERDSGEQASGSLQSSAERLQRGEIGLRHVFINAKSLDDYVSETVSGLKVWSFVD